ncbi:MAG: hypothetical protein ACTS73_02885 [Arsenophonus sp. NEOnobi-MAG3]
MGVFKEFNAKCVRRFLESIINKESILCSYGATQWYKNSPASMKLVRDRG